MRNCYTSYFFWFLRNLNHFSPFSLLKIVVYPYRVSRNNRAKSMAFFRGLEPFLLYKNVYIVPIKCHLCLSVFFVRHPVLPSQLMTSVKKRPPSLCFGVAAAAATDDCWRGGRGGRRRESEWAKVKQFALGIDHSSISQKKMCLLY